MKQVVFLLIFIASIAHAQTTLPASPGGVIPAPDGKTITSAGNIWSCVASSLPPNMTFDGTTLTVPQISTTQLTLTGGTNYPNGTYYATLTSGELQFIQGMVPVTFAVTAQTVTAQNQTVAIQVPLPTGLTAVKLSIMPPLPPTPTSFYPFTWTAYMLNSTTALVQIKNISASNASLPAGSWTLVVN